MLMAESWRNILERAAENLSVELDQRPHPNFRHSRPRAVEPRRSIPQTRSFAETRDLLARELQAVSAQPRSNLPAKAQAEIATPTLMQPVTAPAPLAQPKPLTRSAKRSSWRNVLAISFSGAIIGVTAYAFLSYGQGGTGEAPAKEVPGFRAASVGGQRADSAPVKGVPSGLTRATEEALLERASNLLNNGDAAGGRAVYEELARYGSPRGTFNLAETYDPNALAKHPGWGLKSDLRLARAWYRKAAELGSLTAYERLKDLEKPGGPGQQRNPQLSRVE